MHDKMYVIFACICTNDKEIVFHNAVVKYEVLSNYTSFDKNKISDILYNFTSGRTVLTSY